MFTSTIERRKSKKIGRGYQNHPHHHLEDTIKRLIRRNLHGHLEVNLQSRNLMSVPSDIFNYTAIQKVVLSNNRLEYLHPAISMLTGLQCLQLERNRLSSLPPEMHRCQQLRYFDMSSNRLTTVPTVLLTLQQLKVLSLANNMLQYLPKNFGCLSHLKILNLRGNKLKNLPNSVQNLNKLRELNLSQNVFEQIPSAICLMAHLKIFNMSGNSLTFVAPCLDNMKRLEEMNFSHNLLETVFISVSKLKNMKYLNLSYNHLVTVPTFLFQLPQLKILHLQGNRIGEFPDGLESVTHLNLANNCLKEFSVYKMKNLQCLNVNGNLLKNIPHGLCRLKRLEHFTGNGNQIGHIPQEMKELRRLRTLDIGNNRVTYQPQWIREMTNLEYFNIQGNNLKQQQQQQPYVKSLINQNKTTNRQCYKEPLQHFKERQVVRDKICQELKLCPPKSTSFQLLDNKDRRKRHSSKENFERRGQKPNASHFFLQTVSDSKPRVVSQSNQDTFTTGSLSPTDITPTWLYPVKNTYITYNYVLPERLAKRNNAQETFSSQEDIRASYFSDITNSFDKTESLTTDVSSVDNENGWIEHGLKLNNNNNNNAGLNVYPKLKVQDCCCQNHPKRKMAKELVKVMKETFSISCNGGRFISSLNPNVCLNIPSYNLDHPLQLTMKVVNISEEAVHIAQQRDPTLSNVLSLGVAVILTPTTDVPFEAPLHISLPAPHMVDENVSGCLHLLTAKDDNSCTPFFRKYSLNNGGISLKTYHLAGKVAVITKSKCHYKACKSTETLLRKFLH